MQKGTIWINLEGATREQTERCRQVIHLLFERGIFNIQNGSAELHFDFQGTLQAIKVHQEVYGRKSYTQPQCTSPTFQAIIKTEQMTSSVFGE